jgi:hypothetical protein
MKYLYEAMNPSGEESSGTIEADSVDDANKKLRKHGLFVTKISKPIYKGKPVKPSIRVDGKELVNEKDILKRVADAKINFMKFLGPAILFAVFAFGLLVGFLLGKI